MHGLVLASGVAAAVTVAAEATVTITPVAENRFLHVQGAITPAGGETIFDVQTASAIRFEPFDDSVDLILKSFPVHCSGFSDQTSEILDNQLVASGVSSLTLVAEEPGEISIGNTCSHFILVFDLIEPASYVLTGMVGAVNPPVDTLNAAAWIEIERLADGFFIVDEFTDSGTIDLEFQGTLAPGLYTIRVQTDMTGKVAAQPSALGYAAFDVTLTVQERCADLDDDDIVGITDFLILLAGWGPSDCFGEQSCPDLDGDGIVGIVDFLKLLANWGPCP